MSSIVKKCNALKLQQDNIDSLLKQGLIILEKGESFSKERWSIDEFYHGKECNIGIATCDDAGVKTFPFHICVFLLCLSWGFHRTDTNSSNPEYLSTIQI